MDGAWYSLSLSAEAGWASYCYRASILWTERGTPSHCQLKQGRLAYLMDGAWYSLSLSAEAGWATILWTGRGTPSHYQLKQGGLPVPC